MKRVQPRITWNDHVDTSLLANFKQIVLASSTIKLMEMANEMQSLHEQHHYGDQQGSMNHIGFLTSWIAADLQEEIQKRPDYLEAKAQWEARYSTEDFEE